MKSLLAKSAAEAISGLTLTADYKEATYILKKRFGNKQQIITKHMDILLNVEAVSLQHDIKGLRHLYDLVESQVRSLRSLGVELTSYGSLLLSVLLQNLPPDLHLNLKKRSRIVSVQCHHLLSPQLQGRLDQEMTLQVLLLHC